MITFAHSLTFMKFNYLQLFEAIKVLKVPNLYPENISF